MTDQFVWLFDNAENKTFAELEEVFVGSSRWREPVARYYRTLRQSLEVDNIDVKMHAVLNELLLMLVEVRIDEMVGDSGQDKKRCALDKLSALPLAVGDLSEPLRRSTGVARALVRSLKLAADAMDTVEHVEPTDSCISALLKLTYCAHCDGYVTARPCRPFCYYVLRGCLAELTSVDRYYSSFISTLHHMTDHSAGQYDIEQVVSLLPSRLSDILRDTVLNHRQHIAQVSTGAGSKILHS